MFTKRIINTCLLLAVVCTGLIALVTISNPHISSIKYKNATIQIRLSEDVTQITEISIAPKTTTFSHTVSGDMITINLDEPLHTSTRYEVTLQATDRNNDSFRSSSQINTEQMSYIYLDRTTKPHSIKQATVSGSKENVLFQSETIATFSACRSTLLVATFDDSQDKLVHIGKTKSDFGLPDDQSLSHVMCSHTSDEEAIVVLTETSSYARVSYRLDIANKKLDKIIDSSGNTINMQWVEYMSDGKTIIYEDTSGIIYIDNLTDTQERSAFRGFTSLGRVLPDNKGLFASNGTEYVTIMANGYSTTAPEYISNSIQPIAYNAQNTDFLYGITEFKDNELYTRLFTQRGGTTTLFAKYLPRETLMLQQDLSPDNQYIITYEAAQPVTYDSVKIHQVPQNIIATIRRSSDGQKLKQFSGSLVQWQID